MGAGWLSPWAIYNVATGTYVWKSDDATPQWQFPSRNGYVPILVNDDVYIKHVEHFNKIHAITTDYIRNNEDLSAALPIVFTIDAQPDVPRNITFTFNSHAQITAFTLTIVGTDAKGLTVTEIFTAASGWTFTTSNCYAKITSITLSARTGTGIGDTMDVGISQILGLANNIDAAADVIKIVKSAAAANSVDMAVGDYTAEAVYDSVDIGVGAAPVGGDSFTIYYKSRLHTQA